MDNNKFNKINLNKKMIKYLELYADLIVLILIKVLITQSELIICFKSKIIIIPLTWVVMITNLLEEKTRKILQILQKLIMKKKKMC